MLAFLAAATFTCTPVAVWEGDGPVWCDEGPKIRIANIAARELDGTCSPGHPCPDATGIEARDALVDLLGGPRGELRHGHIVVEYPTIECRRRGTSYERDRAAAWLIRGTTR